MAADVETSEETILGCGQGTRLDSKSDRAGFESPAACHACVAQCGAAVSYAEGWRSKSSRKHDDEQLTWGWERPYKPSAQSSILWLVTKIGV